MNAERLHVIALALNAEFEHSNLVRRFESMVAALEQLANQSHPQHQQNLASNLNSLYESLTNTATDKFPPAWRQVVAELGGNDLIGSTLKKEIEEILQKNQITLAVAVSQFQPILQRVTKFRDAIKQLVSSFGQLNIGKEDLKPGECEFGVLIPRDAVKNELGEFADELEEIKFILDTMSELVSGRKEHLEIKTISSSDLTVYLELSPAVAACVAHAVERIVAISKSCL